MSDHWSDWANYIISQSVEQCSKVNLTDKSHTSIWNTLHTFEIDSDNLKVLAEPFNSSNHPSGIKVDNIKFMYVKKIEDNVALYVQMGGSEDTKQTILSMLGKEYAIITLLPPKSNTRTVINVCHDVMKKLILNANLD
ncbi:hypothetical protein A3Q56_01863 [Intoshia linei]|uniref:Profilin n=1 Tax=Intoshia linei TaxID=1819745 RepID=A0A177BAD9_9BILA|nr:hypothetical protein A3Q56_01863 [Intoshia linei]